MLDAQVDHVAIAVRSISDAMRVYADALGATFLFAGDNHAQGFRWAQFRFPAGGKIELVTPIARDAFLARFLASRGEGVHHVTLKVPDLVASVRALEEKGVPVFGLSVENPDWQEAFIHPRDAHGTLVQLARSRLPDDEVAAHHLAPHEGRDHTHLRLEDLLREVHLEPPIS